MASLSKTMKAPVLTAIFLASCTSCWYDGHGIVGAEFTLASDSKLPGWFNNRNRIPRENISVKIRRYESDEIRETVSINGLFGRKLGEAYGTYRWHPESGNGHRPGSTFPNWWIIRINGHDEVFEQRGMNEFLWIVDKPMK